MRCSALWCRHCRIHRYVAAPLVHDLGLGEVGIQRPSWHCLFENLLLRDSVISVITYVSRDKKDRKSVTAQQQVATSMYNILPAPRAEFITVLVQIQQQCSSSGGITAPSAVGVHQLKQECRWYPNFSSSVDGTKTPTAVQAVFQILYSSVWIQRLQQQFRGGSNISVQVVNNTTAVQMIHHTLQQCRRYTSSNSSVGITSAPTSVQAVHQQLLYYISQEVHQL